MEYRVFGETGLKVSTLSLGTVSLGIPYGIQIAGNFGTPDPASSIRLLRQAADAGINLFDTAPSYGDSEKIIGEALSGRSDLYVATKVSPPNQKTRGERQEAVFSSLQASLRNLRREVLDIVQIHNARAEDILRGELLEFLVLAKEKGLVRFLGASVYDEEAAKQAVNSPHLSVLQLAFSLLDQRASRSVFSLASSRNTAILARSALLKGVLSFKAMALPDQLSVLKLAAEKVRRELDCDWEDLPGLALRFCLFHENISSVLIGARTISELEQALAAWQSGPLSEQVLRSTPSLALWEEELINPTNWPI